MCDQVYAKDVYKSDRSCLFVAWQACAALGRETISEPACALSGSVWALPEIEIENRSLSMRPVTNGKTCYDWNIHGVHDTHDKFVITRTDKCDGYTIIGCILVRERNMSNEVTSSRQGFNPVSGFATRWPVHRMDSSFLETRSFLSLINRSHVAFLWRSGE